MRRIILTGGILMSMTLLACGAAQAKTNDPNANAPDKRATPGAGTPTPDDHGRYCVMFYDEATGPIDPELQQQLDALEKEFGKPAVVQQPGEHVCFQTKEQREQFKNEKHIRETRQESSGGFSTNRIGTGYGHVGTVYDEYAYNSGYPLAREDEVVTSSTCDNQSVVIPYIGDYLNDRMSSFESNEDIGCTGWRLFRDASLVPSSYNGPWYCGYFDSNSPLDC